MSIQAQVKNYWTFVKGLITEAGPLTFPENSARAIDNVVINRDGSIEPRKGFAGQGVFGSPSTTAGAEYELAVNSFLWKGAGSVGEVDILVVQYGRYVRFYTAHSTTPTLIDSVITLEDYIPTNSGYSQADVETSIFQFANLDGKLVVVSGFTDPVLCKYDSQTSTVTATALTLRTRDLTGLEDGTEPDFHPTTLTTEHQYNLYNSGWELDKINSYFAEYAEYPSRSEDPWSGLIDEVNPADGTVTKLFKPELYRADGDVGFGTSEAARGHFIFDVFENTVLFSNLGSVSNVIMTGVTDNGTGGTFGWSSMTITVETSGPGVTEDGTIVLTNVVLDSALGGTPPTSALNGTYDVTYIDATHYSFVMSYTQIQALGLIAYMTPDSSGNWYPYYTLEMGNTQYGVPSDYTSITEPRRFEAVAAHAGRIFYAGCRPDNNKELSGRIYYSQLARTDAALSRCYQSNDPSAKDVNDLLDTDGGYINISNIGTVHSMQVFLASLIIIATNGVWEISSADGYFRPASYTVRKISSRGSRFKGGVSTLDDKPCYWSTQGLEVIVASEVTGQSQVQSLTDSTIKTLVQNRDIVDNSVTAVYDNVNNVAYWGFSTDAASPEYTILAFDTRLGAFYTWSLDIDQDDTRVRAMTFSERDDENGLYLITAEDGGLSHSLVLNAMRNTNNTDTMHDGGSSPFSCLIEAGHETLGDGMRSKQALRVATFCERNEDASLYAQGMYSWSLDADSGKWNNPQQAYRDAGAGHGVSRSRLTMRGNGPSFRIRYFSEDDKPFKLLGWSVLYAGGDIV